MKKYKCIGPVSYTHLDVYKRQAYDDEVILEDFNMEIKKNTIIGIYGKKIYISYRVKL